MHRLQEKNVNRNLYIFAEFKTINYLIFILSAKGFKSRYVEKEEILFLNTFYQIISQKYNFWLKTLKQITDKLSSKESPFPLKIIPHIQL